MRLLFLSSVVILSFSGVAVAQYSGPSENSANNKEEHHQATISEILANPQDEAKVVVEGMLIRSIGDEMYVLSDGNSEINVEIDDDDFPNSPVSDTTRVRVEGEVDTHLIKDTDIEADRVEILD